MTGQEQTPILCSECLGPATPAQDGTVACGYCGHRGVLPQEQLARAMELTRRVRQAATAAAQIRGVESALGHIFESPWAFFRAAGAFMVFGVMITVFSIVTSWDMVANAPASVRPTLIVNAAMGPVAIGGLALSICVALAISRRSYRRAVRPLLFARAPQQPGLPARCRACGGPLPEGKDAFVSCRFCSTQNLVTGELEKNRNQLLETEQRFYVDRAHKVLAATTRSLPNTQRIFIIACAFVYLSLFGMAALANAFLPG